MPINTILCPYCKARVNYSVSSLNQVISQDLEDERIVCPRCKLEFGITKDAISSRVLSDLQDLDSFERMMSSTSEKFEEVFKDDSDTVEHSLEKADQVFQAAKDALDEISLEKTDQVIDADELLKQYAIPDVVISTLKGKTQQIVSEHVSAKYQDSANELMHDLVDSAYDYVDEYVGSRFKPKRFSMF